MKTVVLITQRYAETEHPAALCAQVLTKALSAHGYNVHVICRPGRIPAPMHECCRSITIHRLNVRRDAPERLFAVEASRRLRGLAARRMCDAIECVDAPSCALAATLLREAGGHRAPVISICIGALHTARARTAHSFADRTLFLSEHSRRCAIKSGVPAETTQVIPLPIETNAWAGPDHDCPAFVLASSLEQHVHAAISDAFAQSGADKYGWALAAPGASGHWLVSAEQRSQSIQNNDSVIIVPAADRHEPIAAMLAIAAGHIFIVSDQSQLVDQLPKSSQKLLVYREGDSASLADCMRTIAQMTSAHRNEIAQAISAAIRIESEPVDIVAQHEACWIDSLHRHFPHISMHKTWKLAEHAMVARAAGKMETSQ